MGCAPQQWTTASQEQELLVQTSWQELKKPNEDGATMRLNVWVQNQGSSPVEYDLGFEFFQNGKQIEKAHAGTLCAKPGISYKGKVSGTYFEPVGISKEQLADSTIVVEITPLNIQKVEACSKD